jgi:glutathione S-transferase
LWKGEVPAETDPPAFAPPALRHADLIINQTSSSTRPRHQPDLIINQTSNILLYLGPRLGLVPSAEEDEDGIYHVNELAPTAIWKAEFSYHKQSHGKMTTVFGTP